MQTPTSSQTIGPFWHGLAAPELSDLTRFGVAGPRISLRGRVVDGDAAPVTDACVEIWQASPVASAESTGWGRAATDGDGRFAFVTVLPEPAFAGEAPHLAIMLFARGLLKPLLTRCYFAGDPRNDADPLLCSLDTARRATLLAQREGHAAFRFDLRLQGDGETVFLEI
jgi:protocatechuate 3,4-dioxygenase alpha subunit